MSCNHVSKVLDWKLDDNTRLVPGLFGCVYCDVVSSEPISDGGIVASHSHTDYVDGCFACKIGTLHLGTGDANGNLVANGWTNKKWDGELHAYREARRQGIQPASTKMKDIKKAVEASDKIGQAFQA
jgi:hypothetical protein